MKGSRPGWVEAKEMWPAGCQSWVSRDVVEAGGEAVDGSDKGVAAGHGERAAGEEVALEINEEEGVGGAEGHVGVGGRALG